MARALKRRRITKKQPAPPRGTPRGAPRGAPRARWRGASGELAGASGALAGPVEWFSGSEPLAQAGPVSISSGSEPPAQAEGQGEPPPAHWSGKAAFEWFSVHVRDAEIRQRLNIALEKKRLRRGKRQAVHWDSLRQVEDGFALRWQQPRNYQAGYRWWYLLMHKIPAGQSEWKVVPHAKSPPGVAALAPPRAQQASTERTAASSRAASSALASTERPAASSRTDASTFSWPRFTTRRLLGYKTGEQGIGGLPSMYKRGAHLGEGSFGKVHKCTVGGLELAVKVFERGKLFNALAEASVAEQVAGHPHLVRLVDGIVDPATTITYLVYEFAGVDLTAHLADIGSVDMRRLARQTLEGLAHLHSLGLFHSDLKPPNILVLPQSEGGPIYRVADLGGLTEVGLGRLSNIHLDGARTTLNYRAPEVLLGQNEASGEQWLRADIWAVGIVLCEALGLQFHACKVHDWQDEQAQSKLMLERLLRFRPSPDAAAPYVYQDWPGDVHGRIGSNGVELLDSLLAWRPMARPTCQDCLAHSWLQLSCPLRGFEGSEPPRVFPGGRHSWTMLEGYMAPEVLAWLR